MKFVADFHIHSKYSRATSKDMDVLTLAKWAHLKGITLLGTGDFTHHLWLQELKASLDVRKEQGLLFRDGIYFILSAEVSSIYSQGGRGYRVHNVIMAPSFEVAEEINRMLASYGNIASDGRPILGISCMQLAQELFKISDDIMLVPAHIWTPWFGVLGSNSGFDSLYQAYGEYTEKITALETGLSSDPAMNWRLSALDRYALISNSDSHSPSRLGREANVFSCTLDYWEIKKVLEQKDAEKFLYTVEFFPEEGKYHYDGHRNCNTRFTPQQTKEHQGMCPVCGKPLTKGVLYRVEEMADRPEGFTPQRTIGYKSLIPLDEILAEAKGVGKQSKMVMKEYLDVVGMFGSEFNILVNAEEQELFSRLSPKVAQGIMKVRRKEVSIAPGYDGEYGVIKIFTEESKQTEQLKLF